MSHPFLTKPSASSRFARMILLPFQIMVGLWGTVISAAVVISSIFYSDETVLYWTHQIPTYMTSLVTLFVASVLFSLIFKR